jgi:hypothetical protein
MDGIANDLDLCEGFDDSSDRDDDGTPDGCDETPDGDDPPSNTTDESSGNLTNDGLENTSQDTSNVSNTDSGDTSDDGAESQSEVQSNLDGSSITAQLILSFILIFSGAWLLFYLLAHRAFSTEKHDEQMKSDVFFYESGIQDSTAQFAHVSTMIDLPSLEPVYDSVPFAQPNVATSPPLPAEGLPEGWTMEQWIFYGQQWLDAQK